MKEILVTLLILNAISVILGIIKIYLMAKKRESKEINESLNKIKKEIVDIKANYLSIEKLINTIKNISS